jgi:predicted nucleic acid-binding protein
MKETFADSAYFVALGNPRDEWHGQASEFARSYREALITTEFVLLEVGNYFSKAAFRSSFVQLTRFLKTAPNTEIVPASTDLWQRGFELYSLRQDKEWSLTDCISFLVMSDRNIQDALTADKHFEQAGFNRLLG